MIESFEADLDPAKDIYYYTVVGEHDFLDEEEYPRQFWESQLTYAKKSGKRMSIKLDSHSELVNPHGMFYKKSKIEKWIPVTAQTFKQYLLFLKTKNELFYKQAQRELR